MTENLTGTVALISGASSGIGRATARRLATGHCVLTGVATGTTIELDPWDII